MTCPNTGKIVNNWSLMALAVIVLAIAPCEPATGGSSVAVKDLITDTQRFSQDSGRMILVWWIPLEFWETAMANNPNVPASSFTMILEALRPYTLIAVSSGTIGGFGTYTYKNRPELERGIFLTDQKEEVYLPVSEEAVTADAKVFLEIMRPILKANMGEMGANLNFFLFPSQDKDGDLICPTRKKGSFLLTVDGRTYTYKTPLASLVPARRCQKCQEECSGLWNYCPWCGSKLPEAENKGK